MKHVRCSLLCLLLVIALAMGGTAYAEDISPRIVFDDPTMEGKGPEIRTMFKENATFVSLEDFVTWLYPGSAVTAGEKDATVSCEGRYMEFHSGAIYYYCDGRVLPVSPRCFVQEGVFYVPVRAMAAVFSYDVSWDNSTLTATLTSNGKELASGEEYYDYSDYILLAKLIQAESGNQSLEGKIAVGNVIMNRVSSALFPNSVHDVIYDRRSGIQFTTAYNGRINNNPSQESLIASKLCLEGYSVAGDSIFFFNPRLCSASWIKNNRRFVMHLGDHDFYA